MPKLSNKRFDQVKWFTTIVLPAFGALYFGLGETLGLPAVTEVVGTVTLLATFLGTVLGVSTKKYNTAMDATYGGRDHDGDIFVVQDPGGVRTAEMRINGDPEELLANNDVLTFRVQKDAAQ